MQRMTWLGAVKDCLVRFSKKTCLVMLKKQLICLGLRKDDLIRFRERPFGCVLEELFG